MEEATAAKPEKLPTHVKIVFGLLIGVFAGLAANLIGSGLARRPAVERDTWFQRWSADADQSGVADGVEFIARDVAETELPTNAFPSRSWGMNEREVGA